MNKLDGGPKITVVTVVYNGEQYIEATIQSVIGQTYNNIEYIIIDGGSTDQTVDIIRRYEDRLSQWISEPDNGIYDAMNKGIDFATGEWIIFMNAGDKFYSPFVLEHIFMNVDQFQKQMIYGHCNIIYNSGCKRIKKARPIKDLWKGMLFSHQSLFTPSPLLKKHKFNCSNKIGADFEFIYDVYINGHQFEMVDTVVASISAGGLSDHQRIKSIISHWKVVRKYLGNRISINLYYSMLLADTCLRQTIKKVLPEKIIFLLYRHKMV